ncbi:MAG: hypothetical protein M1836_004858 [Candelina mexicana]|nr:MAG: hypothetical protein M1836_004858 [Candelina mexicana]
MISLGGRASVSIALVTLLTFALYGSDAAASPIDTTTNVAGTITQAPSEVSPIATSTSSPAATPSAINQGTHGDFANCHNIDGPFAPFCKPDNGSDAWVGETYHVSWDPDVFTKNSTITVVLNYANASGGGSEAWHSDKIQNSYGFVSVTMDKAWLKDTRRNNLTLYIIGLDAKDSSRASTTKGPTISLINKPVEHAKPPPLTKMPNKLGLAIGLPVSLGFVALVVLGLYFGMRKTRRIGIASVMGRKKGYGERRSRRQRMRRGKKGELRLDEDEPEAPDYRDEPTQGVELQTRKPRLTKDESLSDLVSSPTTGDFGDDSRLQRNAFREEVSRQRTGR